MNKSCLRDDSMTSSYFWTMHLTLIISLPVNLVGLYCVILKSPGYMSRYKWYMAHHMFWVLILDLHITTLIIPDFLFPIAAANIMGLLIKILPIKIIAVIGVSSAGALISTLLNLFLYRHQVIIPEFHSHHLGKIPRYALLTAVYVYFPGCSIPVLFMLPSDQQGTKQKIASSSCAPKELFLEETAVIDQQNFLFTYIYMLIFVLVASALAAFLMLDAFHFLNGTMSHISSQVKQLHVAALRVLIIQVSVPALMLGLPMGALLVGNILSYTEQILTCAVMQTVAFHGTVGTIMMIIMNPSYRKFVLKHTDSIRTVRVTPTTTNIREELKRF